MPPKDFFDLDGNLLRRIPRQCLRDCGQPGPCDDAIEYWVRRLGFTVPRPLAVDYLAATGGWERAELEREDDDILAGRCLWLLSCDYRESGREPEGLHAV